MKYMLIMQINPVALDALTDEQREEIMKGHGAFVDTIKASGEMVETHALGIPADSAVVRVRDGQPVVTDGPYLEAKEFMGGYYIVDCETRERALELAALIPDAGVEGLGIEVRPIMFSSGPTD
ncbi:YciI family protein [Pseudonocardia aurantiaca]|uniref:YciI family protein n=1 Tax=Pseudonocardia aurantiaca TaxID=75290 RepID=A0ABW4FB45_9PSEU